jgi:TRAP-type C4-dicarboxylate transport system substrate-binding protein
VPFTIPSLEIVMNSLNGRLGERIRVRLAEKKNVLILGYTPRPARRLAAKKPIRTPEDVKGLKLRLPEIRDFALAWKALGAIPIAVEGAEQFTALQTGVADAAENPPSAMWAFRYHEVLKYLMLTDHVYGFRAWSVSKKFYDGLTAGERDLFSKALKEAMDYHTQLAHEEDTEYIGKLTKAGMQPVKVDTKPFRRGVRPAVEEIRKDWAPGLYEEFVKPHLD